MANACAGRAPTGFQMKHVTARLTHTSEWNQRSTNAAQAGRGAPPRGRGQAKK